MIVRRIGGGGPLARDGGGPELPRQPSRPEPLCSPTSPPLLTDLSPRGGEVDAPHPGRGCRVAVNLSRRGRSTDPFENFSIELDDLDLGQIGCEFPGLLGLHNGLECGERDIDLGVVGLLSRDQLHP